jgi:hypothetical protein
VELTLLEAESPPASTSPPLLLHVRLLPVATQMLQPTLPLLLAAATAVPQRPNALLRKTQSIATRLKDERSGKINHPALPNASSCGRYEIHCRGEMRRGMYKGYLAYWNWVLVMSTQPYIPREVPLLFFRNRTAIGFKFAGCGEMSP